MPKQTVILSLAMKQRQHTGGNVSIWDSDGNWSHGTVSGGTPGYTYLSIVDAKTGETLYSDVRKWVAFGSATRNMIRDLQKRIELQEQSHK